MKKNLTTITIILSICSTSYAELLGWDFDGLFDNYSWSWGVYEQKSNITNLSSVIENSVYEKTNWSAIRWQGVNSDYNLILGKDKLSDLSFYFGFAKVKNGNGSISTSANNKIVQYDEILAQESYNIDLDIHYGKQHKFINRFEYDTIITPFVGIISNHASYKYNTDQELTKIMQGLPPTIQALGASHNNSFITKWISPTIGIDMLITLDKQWQIGSNIALIPTGNYYTKSVFSSPSGNISISDTSKIKGLNADVAIKYKISPTVKSEILFNYRKLDAPTGELTITSPNNTQEIKNGFKGATLDDKSIQWRIVWNPQPTN